MNFVAKAPDNLLAILREVDITVPLVTEGRTSQHRERYQMARFLATVADSDRLQYPLTIAHRDKPDFDLGLNAERIGVECVEAVPEEWYEIEAIRERHFPDALNSGQRFRPGKKVFSAGRKQEIASGSDQGLPWVGDMAVRQWAEAMEYFIRAKTTKLRAGNYAEFSRVWLLIQDEWRVPVCNSEKLQAAAHLCLAQIADLQVEPRFSSVFISSGDWLLTLGQAGLAMEPVRDLWHKT